MWTCFSLALLYTIQPNTILAKNMGQIEMLLGNIVDTHSWMHIGCMLSHLIDWVEFLFLALFLTIVGLYFY